MIYLAGYLGAWSAAGILYALVHWGLDRAGLVTSEMRLASTPLAGLLLLAAGVWQWLPAKAACAARCRSPLGFMLNDWREGSAGAFLMGLHYAAWCVGC